MSDDVLTDHELETLELARELSKSPTFAHEGALVAIIDRLLSLVAQQQKVVEAARKVHGETRFIDDEGCTSRACTLTSYIELGEALRALPSATKEK